MTWVPTCVTRVQHPSFIHISSVCVPIAVWTFQYRLLKGDWHQDKENATTKGDKDASLAASVQRETRLKQMREEEKRAKEEEIAHLQETLNALTQENEAEFLALEDLEALLIKNKEKVEKQRRWSETQSSYRICLERMIRDTMHQYVCLSFACHSLQHNTACVLRAGLRE